MSDILFNILFFYLCMVLWVHGWLVGCERELRPQPPSWLRLTVAFCWPAILWYAYKHWRSLR